MCYKLVQNIESDVKVIKQHIDREFKNCFSMAVSISLKAFLRRKSYSADAAAGHLNDLNFKLDRDLTNFLDSPLHFFMTGDSLLKSFN